MGVSPRIFGPDFVAPRDSFTGEPVENPFVFIDGPNDRARIQLITAIATAALLPERPPYIRGDGSADQAGFFSNLYRLNPDFSFPGLERNLLDDRGYANITGLRVVDYRTLAALQEDEGGEPVLVASFPALRQRIHGEPPEEGLGPNEILLHLRLPNPDMVEGGADSPLIDEMGVREPLLPPAEEVGDAAAAADEGFTIVGFINRIVGWFVECIRALLGGG